MRPLVPSRSALAAVALFGALAAGMSVRSDERADGPAPHSDAPARERATPTPTPGFFGGSLPPDLLRRVRSTSLQEAPQEAPPTTPQADCFQLERGPLPHHEFYFTRAIYNEGGGLRGFGRFRGRGSWAIDYPKADRQFMVMVDHLINIDLFPCANAVRLDDPAIRNFPFLYALEVGGIRLSDAEVQGLRDYLNAGGFLVIDDFWGSWEWETFEREIRRVLPGRPIVEIPMDHPVFHTVYDIDEIIQVPNRSQGRGGPTWERDGRIPHARGIFDDHERLMVMINWNTDLGDAWEWAEDPFYQLKYSTFAAEMGINMIVYGMSH